MKKIIIISLLLISNASFAIEKEAKKDSSDMLSLASSKNCLACHAVDKKIVGPSYKDVKDKYAKDDKAVSKLAEKIIKGGKGVWGEIPMPANPQVNKEESEKLAKWVLGK